MSLPENPYDKIDHDYRVTVARDKEWAKWIWNNCIIDDYGVVALEFYTDAAKADLEALKKLAEG